jgi:hypothetical protein
MTRTDRRWPRLLAPNLLGATALVLVLGGCKVDNRPLLARGDPAPAAPALGPLDPTYAAATPTAYLSADQAYAYPQRAYAVSRAVRERPPSYAFSYGDEQPWAWDAADQGLMFAEPVGQNWRYYYYETGDAYPYFVQDPDYGYAYGDNGVLLALFDAAGGLVGSDRYATYAPRASGYWSRAHDLNRSYWSSPRHRVEQTAWRERAPALVATQDRWFRSASAQPAWDQARRHDNGRDLGWEHDHGRREPGRQDRRREIAFANPPAPRARPEFHRERGPSHQEGHAFAAARQEWRPQPAQEHRQDRPQPARWSGGPGAHGGHQGHGGQAFAQNAEAHARPAAWHGPDQAQGQARHDHPGGGPQHGGGHENNGGHGGGGDHGKGGEDHGGGHGHGH